ncbi:MAG: ATP-dependent DNA helicase RecG [Chloroflexi bacterium]|nr:ATP-dependent DNA helicase RecG [Chloroflexota bacterium]
MSADLVRLGEILRRELEAGCSDRLVAGGLDTLLRVQARDEDPRSPLLRMVAALPANGYRALDAESRQRWLRRALATLAAEPEGKAGRGTGARAAGRRTAPARRRPDRPAGRDRSGGRGRPVPIPDGPEALALPIAAAGGRAGKATLERLERLGLRTVGDALRHFPSRHIDFSRIVPIAQLRIGTEQTIRGRLDRVREVRMGRGGRLRSTEATLSDQSGASIRVVWFNQPYLARQLSEGSELAIAGTVRAFRGRPRFDNPEFEHLAGDEDGRHTGRLVPVYGLTAGLRQRTLRSLIASLVERYVERVPEPLPRGLIERHGLPPLAEAMRQLHYPDDASTLARARRRLAFDELLGIQIGVVRRRRAWRKSETAPAIAEHGAARSFVADLPFELTAAQRRTLHEVLEDLERPVPMSRLLEGDVGSGKTVVALAAMLDIVAAGRQAALMAPTEVLAEQHLRTIRRLLTGSESPPLGGVVPLPYLPAPLRLLSLTGSARAKERRDVLAALAYDETPQIVVGTHALIQEDVVLPRLGLAVVDEQHRFGVRQRAALRERSRAPRAEGDPVPPGEAPACHLLVMSATPIPRSLALTLYGDLDLSLIDEMPPGRAPIESRWLDSGDRRAAFDRLRSEVEAGRQGFVICPLVEGSEAVASRAATEEHERIRRDELPEQADRVALLHGRLPAREKEEGMARFVAGEAQVLVSTAVVEVGIDVPNATVMLIEGADRFGLAQLHQFRGRIGRGRHQSWCFLLADEPSEEARRRLSVAESTLDGFQLAQADLELRGPGELYGLRQSGASVRVAALLDAPLIDATRREAEELLGADPELSAADHAGLRSLAAGTATSASGAGEAH